MVEKLLIANENLLILHVDLALRVLDLVHRDGYDAKDKEESGHDRRSDHISSDSILIDCDIVELIGECFVICRQVLTKVVQGPGCAVDWI